MSSDFLRKAIGASGLRQYLYQLRRALAGSRYRVERHHDLATEPRERAGAGLEISDYWAAFTAQYGQVI
jgi:hypothetical protein